MKDIKTALIGCGRIGFLLENDPLRYKPCTHYGGIKATGLQIDCACDIDTNRLKKFTKTAKIPEKNVYTDYRELILKEKPHLVIIATWTNTHAEIGILAAINGAKTIICEKPVSSNLGHARSFLEECERHNVNLIINHERRYDTRYRAVKKMLDKGRIGQVKTVHASILTSGSNGSSRIENGGGPLLHDGTHIIDIIRYFFGDISHVRGEIQNKRSSFEHRATAWLKTATGIDVFLEAGGSRNYYMFELQISGTEGKIIIGNGYQHLYMNRKSRYYIGFKDLSEKPFPMNGIKDINYFKREYLEAKNTLNGNSADISSRGLDGYKALEAIHAIYLSSYLKSKRIDLPVKPEKINLKKIFGI